LVVQEGAEMEVSRSREEKATVCTLKETKEKNKIEEERERWKLPCKIQQRDFHA